MARIEQTRPGQQSRLELGSELIEIGTDGLLHRKKERSKKQVLPFQCEGGMQKMRLASCSGSTRKRHSADLK